MSDKLKYEASASAPETPAVDVVSAQAAGIDGHALASDPHRGLRMRHVQLIAISGSIGAALFVSIGNPLTPAGPLGLLIGVILWCSVVWAASNCLVEMTTLHPVDGGFVSFAGRFVDESFGMALGWNYIITQWALICFEYAAIGVIVSYWQEVHPAIIVSAGIVSLGVINLYSVRWFGEIEFWISITKVLLILGLTLYTFITMVGGNPLGDRYGFRYWKNPGPFNGQTGVDVVRGIFDAISWGTFAIVGPDYISLIGGEVKHPRRILPKAFATILIRITLFYVVGALCVGIVAAANDESLLGAISAGAPGAARSPYVISMNRLGIKGLPDLVNALILVSIFSTTNSFVFAASRSVYGMARVGRAPRFLVRTNKQGVPYLCVALTLLVSCLAYLSVSNDTVKVLNWWINLVTAAQLVTWTCIAITSIRFRAALKSQRLFHILPVVGRLMPYSAWYLLTWAPIVFIFSGYYLFYPGAFAAADFVFAYGSIFIFLAILIGNKTYRIIRGKGQDGMDGTTATTTASSDAATGTEAGKRRVGWIPADQVDLTSGLEEFEAMTLAAEEKRLARKPTRMQRLTDFLF